MANRSWSRASIISRMFGTPLAVLPETAAIVLGAVGPRLDVAQLFVTASGESASIADLSDRARAEVARLNARGPIDRRAPLERAARLGFVFNRVMHVPVRGETVAENDGAIGPSSGFTGYDGIRAQVMAADEDPEIGGILLDVDSPGGEVASLFELADFLMARRGKKPMRAMIRDVGASAAYTIACCADPGQVTLHPLGRAGSNGVITMHADFSGSLEQDGIAVRLFASGSHKADGNPFEPLPDDVAARIQAMVDTSAARLFAHVGKARGMKPEAVQAQQAQVYLGEEAVAAGLVDKIMSWDESMTEFEQLVNGTARRPAASSPARRGPGATSMKEKKMDTIDNALAAINATDASEADQRAALTALVTNATAAGNTAGVMAERARITELASLDAGSTLSDGVAAAIEAGDSAGDFAIAQQKAALAAGPDALAKAKADAANAEQLPKADGGAAPGGAKANRGQAWAEAKKARAAA